MKMKISILRFISQRGPMDVVGANSENEQKRKKESLKSKNLSKKRKKSIKRKN